MHLYAKILPDYFNMLGKKRHEFRQIESITLENSVTGETKEFLVSNIIRLDAERAGRVRENYYKVPWQPKLPIFAIELGDEIKFENANKSCAEVETREQKDDEGKYEFFDQRRKVYAR